MKTGKVLAEIRAMSLHDWRILLTSIMLFPVVSLLLRRTGYNRTRDMLSRIQTEKGARQDSDKELEKALRIARMVSHAARFWFYRDSCLQQSLLTWWLLARHGISSEIRFGVPSPKSPAFLAHAWVDYQGVNLCETSPG